MHSCHYCCGRMQAASSMWSVRRRGIHIRLQAIYYHWSCWRQCKIYRQFRMQKLVTADTYLTVPITVRGLSKGAPNDFASVSWLIPGMSAGGRQVQPNPDDSCPTSATCQRQTNGCSRIEGKNTSSRLFSAKTVADVAFGHDVDRTSRIVFNLLP
jgi:hypothetical protein